MNNLKIVIVLFAGFFLTGCAAVGVLSTNNPKQKIADAYWLFDEKQRPLRAEPLIKESITIYQSNNNAFGLAEAYVAYGIFLRSYAVERHESRYRKYGFLDKSITYDNRYVKSIEYFEKAAKIFKDSNNLDKLTNVYLHMGFTYGTANLMGKACEKFRQSIVFNKEFKKQNPNATIQLNGHKSYKKYIQNLLKEGGVVCNTSI